MVRNPGEIKPAVPDLKNAAVVIAFKDRESEAIALSSMDEVVAGEVAVS